MKTKNVVAQHIFTHDALYRRSALLDQMKEGLKAVGVLQLAQTFPEEMSTLFTYTGKLVAMVIIPLFGQLTYTGELTADEVLEAVFVEGDLEDNDALVLHLFKQYIRTLSCSGKQCPYSDYMDMA